MDDAEYLFKQDCREKKITAYSANKKVRHTGCKLPSDFMTQREKKTLTGEVHIMNIHKPMTYKYFKTLPKDLQGEFLQFLKDEFSCSVKELQRKWGISTNSAVLLKYCARSGVNYPFRKGQKGYAEKDGRWDKFWAGEEWRKPENAPENHENDRRETNNVSESIDIPVENTSENSENGHNEKHIEEATKKLWNDMAEEAKWKLVEQTRETLAELESKIVSNSPALKTCGRYGGAQAMTPDEVVMEQPFSTYSINISLRDIRDWDSVIKALSAFPLPEHNTVTVSIFDTNKEK